MSKLDARFEAALLDEKNESFSCFVTVANDAPTQEQIDELNDLGCRYLGTINIFTATLTRENVEKVAALEYVDYLELSRKMRAI